MGTTNDQCEDARRVNMGEDDWTDVRCDRSYGHSGMHVNDDYGQWGDA